MSASRKHMTVMSTTPVHPVKWGLTRDTNGSVHRGQENKPMQKSA